MVTGGTMYIAVVYRFRGIKYGSVQMYNFIIRGNVLPIGVGVGVDFTYTLSTKANI